MTQRFNGLLPFFGMLLLPLPGHAGGRYALVISNQDYACGSFPDLVTPKADGYAVAALPADRYGFKLLRDRGQSPMRAQFRRSAFQVPPKLPLSLGLVRR